MGTKLTRRDYIEVDYVDGVIDPDTGKEVIRPMNDAEKAWLAQFVLETEHGNFKRDEELKAKEDELRALRKAHRASKKAGNVEEMSRLETAEKTLYELILRLREEQNTFYTRDEDRREIWTRDNQRRDDIYNNAKINGNLIMFDLDEYEKFDSEKSEIDGKHLLIDRTTKRREK